MTTTLDPQSLPPLPLPPGITSRYIDTSPHSLVFHILESHPETDNTTAPTILLIHGFPELAFSWRHMLPRLSRQGYHAIALDQRGYGRTHPPASQSPLPQSSFRPVNLIRDILLLTSALGYSPTNPITCIVGHDFGAVTASLCALARPDLFRSCILMSHPTKGPPPLPLNTANHLAPPSAPKTPDIHTALASLSPPRKHYKWYYCTDPANAEMTHPTGAPLHDFLRGYFHLKSADWAGNAPHRLAAWTADELAQMPTYYIMTAPDSMRACVAAAMASEAPQTVSRLCARWLPDADLAVYVAEYTRNTFQGGLNWYRLQTSPDIAADTQLYAGLKISVPCMFVAGDKDWGTWQEPGAVEAMESGKSVRSECWRGMRLVPGAGHWVNQEQAEVCVGLVREMVESLGEEGRGARL